MLQAKRINITSNEKRNNQRCKAQGHNEPFTKWDIQDYEEHGNKKKGVFNRRFYHKLVPFSFGHRVTKLSSP